MPAANVPGGHSSGRGYLPPAFHGGGALGPGQMHARSQCSPPTSSSGGSTFDQDRTLPRLNHEAALPVYDSDVLKTWQTLHEARLRTIPMLWVETRTSDVNVVVVDGQGFMMTCAQDHSGGQLSWKHVARLLKIFAFAQGSHDSDNEAFEQVLDRDSFLPPRDGASSSGRQPPRAPI